MSSTPCRPRKPATGSLPFPSTCSCPTYHRDVAMCPASWRSELVDSSIGNSASRSSRRSLLPEFEKHSDLYMQNPPDLMQSEPTSGKKTPESMEPNLNSERSPSVAMPSPIGMPFSWQPRQEISQPSQLMSKYVVITNCDALVQTMYNLCLWNDSLKFSGAELGLGKVVVHGTKQGSKLTVKILEPSGGMDTWVKLTLSSMNSGEPLISSTSSDGLIVTQYVWRTRVGQCHCQPNNFGLRRTLIHGCGIRMWTARPLQH